MKIGIYADAHFSRAPKLQGKKPYKYSTRLDSLVESFDWMYGLFRNEDVDIIVNLGDLISSDYLDAETNSALSMALSKNESKIQEIHLIGNHERKSYDSKFTSVDLLSNYDYITVINDFHEIDFGFLKLIFKSFTGSQEDIDSFTNEKLIDCDKDFVLFTHNNYVGELPFNNQDGFNCNIIESNQHFKYAFNGHIHNPKDSGNYVQVGSITGSSFGDSYSNSFPRVIIFDTDSMTYKSYLNPYALLFFTFEIKQSSSEASKAISSLPKDSYCNFVRFKAPIRLSESLNDITNNLDNESLGSIRLKYSRDNEDTRVDEIVKSERYCEYNIVESLKNFVEDFSDSLPCSLEDAIDFINDNYKMNGGDLA